MTQREAMKAVCLELAEELDSGLMDDTFEGDYRVKSKADMKRIQEAQRKLAGEMFRRAAPCGDK